MSVHGEFSRSLEGVLEVLRSDAERYTGPWSARLEAARLDTQPDLSSAARAALSVIEDMTSSPERLTSVTEHLAALCRVILGLDPQ